MFNERKVSGLLYGHDFKMVSAMVGNNSMVTDMRNFGFDDSYSSLTSNKYWMTIQIMHSVLYLMKKDINF